MHPFSRIILLAASAFCVGFFGLVGPASTRVFHPDLDEPLNWAAWSLFGAMLAAPLWVPAVVPPSGPCLLFVCRWLSALILIVSAMFTIAGSMPLSVTLLLFAAVLALGGTKRQ